MGIQFSSVQFSRSVVSDSLWLHGLQHARLPCPSPTPGAYSNSCPLHWRCHPTISSSVVPFSRLQSFPASGAFPMSQFFTSGGQRIGVSASASVLPMNLQYWFPLGPQLWGFLPGDGDGWWGEVERRDHGISSPPILWVGFGLTTLLCCCLHFPSAWGNCERVDPYFLVSC